MQSHLTTSCTAMVYTTYSMNKTTHLCDSFNTIYFNDHNAINLRMMVLLNDLLFENLFSHYDYEKIISFYDIPNRNSVYLLLLLHKVNLNDGPL